MVIKLNTVRLNCASLNHASLNGVGERLRASAGGGGGEVIPPDIPVTYTLSASVENGSVKATVNGVAVTLPYTANEGEVVVVEVTANDGYEFEGWSDGNKSNPRTVTMTGNVVLSASCVEIAKPTYTLSASVTNGKVSAKRNGSAVTLPFTANEGDTIVLSVTPNDGYAFEGWADGNTDNPRTITMTADKVLSAQCVEVVVPPSKEYIQFEDKAVEAICVANWSSDGIGLTEEDAAKVTDIGLVFNKNTEIKRFNEFRYFVAVRSLRGDDNASLISERGAFYGCSALQSIQFPPSLDTINGGAFANTTALAINVDIPSLKYIRNNAFKKSGIISITNLGTITELGTYGTLNYGGEGVFYECANLTIAEIPSSVINIPAATFYKCSALTKIICRATIPPTLGIYAFNRTNDCPIYVPDASLEAYKTATNWNTYADRIHPLSEIEGSPYITFADAEVERVLMSKGVSSDGVGITKEDAASVTSISTWFRENTEVTSFDELQYFTGVKNIEQYGLYNMTNLESVNLCNIQSVAGYFIGKNKMPKIVMESLTTTTGASFGYTNIPIIILPAIETMKGSDFFQPSASIKMIMFGKSVQSIGHYAFWGFKDSTTTLVCLATTPPTLASNNNLGFMSVIYVPDASVAAYQSATKWSEASAKFKGISQLATDNPSLYSEIEKYL